MVEVVEVVVGEVVVVVAGVVAVDDVGVVAVDDVGVVDVVLIAVVVVVGVVDVAGDDIVVVVDPLEPVPLPVVPFRVTTEVGFELPLLVPPLFVAVTAATTVAPRSPLFSV